MRHTIVARHGSEELGLPGSIHCLHVPDANGAIQSSRGQSLAAGIDTDGKYAGGPTTLTGLYKKLGDERDEG